MIDGCISNVKGDEMTDQAGVTISDAATERTIPYIEADGLTAEYSTGCTPTGEWFALGTITRNGGRRVGPASVIVGTGSSADEAVSSLTLEIRARARDDVNI